MPSADLTELLRLLAAGFRIERIETRLTRVAEPNLFSGILLVQLTNGPDPRDIESGEEDLFAYCGTFNRSLDSQGNTVLRRFRDQKRYDEELLQLQDRGSERRKSIGDRYKSGQLRLAYDPKALLAECLKSRDWGASRFLRLKRDHFEIALAVLLESNALLQSHRQLYDAYPEAKPYGVLTEQILNAAWQKETTFMKRCLRFLDYAKLDIDDAIWRAHGQAKHVHDLFQMVAPRTPMPARQGLPYLLDAYWRYCEALKPFITALGQALRIAEGQAALPKNTPYQEIVDVIKSSRYGAVVDCLDPAIRNSEAHHGTDYDDEAALVVLTKPLADGVRKTLGSYTYRQISDMTLRLERRLFPAVLSEFAVHQIGLVATVMDSPEYVDLLLSIDNLAE
jgi:hypothetical protein